MYLWGIPKPHNTHLVPWSGCASSDLVGTKTCRQARGDDIDPEPLSSLWAKETRATVKPEMGRDYGMVMEMIFYLRVLPMLR